MLAYVPLPKVLDRASLMSDAILGSCVLSRLRKWRNWQTRKPQELVPHKGVGVQIPPSAPNFLLALVVMKKGGDDRRPLRSTYTPNVPFFKLTQRTSH